METLNQKLKIVGLGASAGGMQPLKEFFEAMPSDSGLAFVVIQHLDPQHESHMAPILARCTQMKVSQAEEGSPIEANCVYTIPSNTFLSFKEGTLHLSEPIKSDGLRMPIDFFFRALARQQHDKAVGVLFSGSGSDGTLGIREIRGEGGLVIVQEPASAQFAPMIENAIATGLVDHVLPVRQMPAVIIDYMQRSFSDSVEPVDSVDVVRGILDLLARETKADFHSYRKSTLHRRIQRRMALNQISDVSDYFVFLRQNRDELQKLSKDMLIGVTSFFRDPSAFEELREKVVIPLVQKNTENDSIRVWVAGCSTGEEAYSIVILFLEEMARAKKNIPLVVFASDLEGEGLKFGRQGIYPESISADVSEERLARFFTKMDHSYQVNKQVRGMVTFSKHNLLANPPFFKMDLISCRNLLMYIEPTAQGKILNIFGFGLNPGGHLFLGKSDTVIEKDLFEPVSSTFRIFRRNSSVRPRIATFPTASQISLTEPQKQTPVRLPELNQQVLLTYFHASIVLVNEKGEILHFYGPTQQYLSHPAGTANLKFFDMLENQHSLEFRSAVEKARRERRSVRLGVLRFGGDDSDRRANVTIMPIPEPQSGAMLFAVIFEQAEAAVEAASLSTETSQHSIESAPLVPLEAEVAKLREQLQNATETFQTTHEELTAANEEVLAINEELQSTNEELETSKEELQSVNEEIVTANNQLNDKLDELNKINNDLANFLNSSEIGTIFLDGNFRIRRFTPSATTLLNILPVDVGRPIQHISNNFVAVDFPAIAGRVLTTLVQVQEELETTQGHWYMMRCLPYRTLDNVIDGVVFTFSDITELKRSEAAIKQAREYAENIINTTRESFVVLDVELRVVSANRAFYETFQVSPGETENRSIYELGSGQWNVPRLRELLEEILAESTHFENFELEHEFPNIGRKIMALNARKIEPQLNTGPLILLAIEDVTGRRRAESQIKQLNETLGARVTEQIGYARLLHLIANAANSAISTEQVLQLAIDDVCDYFGWPVGHVYFVEDFGGKLISGKIWHLKDPDRFAAFRNVSEALSFSPGIGFPAAVMVQQRPRWMDNVAADPDFLRAGEAATAGLKGRLAVPVFAQGKIAAVLEFFTSELESASDALLEVMEQVGVELGQVFERKWAEKKLRESERLSALGITTSAIIHEIANPLQLIAGITHLLKQPRNTEEEKKEGAELLSDLNDEVARLIALLGELRFAASPGLTKLDLEPTNVALFAVECLMKDKFPSSYPLIRLEHDLPPDLPSVMIDRNKMRQVLLNLYKNAAEAMPDGGTLSIKGFRSGDRICLDVADTGMGIPEGVNVFEPSVTTKPHGMGLGLMIVQQIVSAHRGSITYTSQSGRGTVFRISLPASDS